MTLGGAFPGVGRASAECQPGVGRASTDLLIIDRSSDGARPLCRASFARLPFVYNGRRATCSKGASQAPSEMWQGRFQAKNKLDSLANVKFNDCRAIKNSAGDSWICDVGISITWCWCLVHVVSTVDANTAGNTKNTSTIQRCNACSLIHKLLIT